MEDIKIKEIFENIYEVDLGDGVRRIATKSLVEGKRIYGEKIIKIDGVEYRIWNPNKSKLAAAIINGLKIMPIKKVRRFFIWGHQQEQLRLMLPILLKNPQFIQLNILQEL